MRGPDCFQFGKKTIWAKCFSTFAQKKVKWQFQMSLKEDREIFLTIFSENHHKERMKMYEDNFLVVVISFIYDAVSFPVSRGKRGLGQ